MIKSGILIHPGVDFQYWNQVLDLILELAKKKSWLQEECGWILYSAIKNFGKGSHNSKYVQLIVDKIQSGGLTKTPEGIAIWILTTVQFDGVKLPKGVWHHKNPLHREEKAELATILKEASPKNLERGGDDENASRKGTWTPKLHFAWDVVLSRVLDRQSLGGLSSKNSRQLDLATFWDECVDSEYNIRLNLGLANNFSESLFADSSSEERKYWGFVIFQRALRETPSSSFFIIFSKHFMRCLRNQLASPKRYLHLIANKSLKAILQRIKIDVSSAVQVLESLISPPKGEIDFDKISKTKTIEKIIVLVKDMYLKNLVQVFHRLVLQPGTPDEKAAELKRQSLGDQLVDLVRVRSIGNEISISSDASDCFQDILSFLTTLAYFNRTDGSESSELPANPPVSLISQNMFKSRISSCLTHLMSKSAGPSFAYFVVCKIRLRDLKGISKLVLQPSDTAGQTVREAWEVLEKIHIKLESVNYAKKPHFAAFELLYSLTILQVYNFDADAVSMLDELKDCYDKLVKHKHGARGGSDVLVEIILSYVAKPSQLFRHLGQQVFSAFTSDMNEVGLQSMIKVCRTSVLDIWMLTIIGFNYE